MKSNLWRKIVITLLPFKGHFYREGCVCVHIHNLYVSNIISQVDMFFIYFLEFSVLSVIIYILTSHNTGEANKAFFLLSYIPGKQALRLILSFFFQVLQKICRGGKKAPQLPVSLVPTYSTFSDFYTWENSNSEVEKCILQPGTKHYLEIFT